MPRKEVKKEQGGEATHRNEQLEIPMVRQTRSSERFPAAEQPETSEEVAEDALPF